MPLPRYAMGRPADLVVFGGKLDVNMVRRETLDIVQILIEFLCLFDVIISVSNFKFLNI